MLVGGWTVISMINPENWDVRLSLCGQMKDYCLVGTEVRGDNGLGTGFLGAGDRPMGDLQGTLLP